MCGAKQAATIVVWLASCWLLPASEVQIDVTSVCVYPLASGQCQCPVSLLSCLQHMFICLPAYHNKLSTAAECRLCLCKCTDAAAMMQLN